MSSEAQAPAADPLLLELRDKISGTDRAIVELVNRRLELAKEIKRHKASQGIAFLDPAREEWMVQYVTRTNRGPLSRDGLRAFYAELLALTKQELEQA